MQRATFVLLLAATTTFGCATEMTTREKMVEQQAVEDRLNQWTQLQNNAKVDSLMTFYDHAPELLVVWPDGKRAEGPDQVQQMIQDFYNSIQYMNLVLAQPVTQVLDAHTAVTTFRHSTDVVQAGGNRLPLTAGNGVLVWVKDPQDRTWKIHDELRAVNYTPPSPPSGRRRQ